MIRAFSSVQLADSGNLDDIRLCVESVVAGSPQGVLVLIGCQSEVDLESLSSYFSSLPVPAVGVVMPGVIFQEALFFDRVVVCGMESYTSSYLIKDINRPESVIRDELTNLIPREEIRKSAVLVIDGMSHGVDNYIHCLFDHLGSDVELIGVGCGDLEFSSRPNLVTADGLLNDSALLLFQDIPLTTSFHHGWQEIAGPFLVNSSEGNIIHQLNYQPALTVYKSVIEQSTSQTVDFSDFFKVAQHFPFGLEQLEGEFLVRDPINSVRKSIECAGTTPTNAMVYILRADNKDLIDAAGQAASELTRNLSPVYQSDNRLFVFIVDCVSRYMVLAQDMKLELGVIRQNLPEKASMVGVLSIGEIATTSQGNILFQNKSIVVGGLGK